MVVVAEYVLQCIAPHESRKHILVRISEEIISRTEIIGHSAWIYTGSGL